MGMLLDCLGTVCRACGAEIHEVGGLCDACRADARHHALLRKGNRMTDPINEQLREAERKAAFERGKREAEMERRVKRLEESVFLLAQAMRVLSAVIDSVVDLESGEDPEAIVQKLSSSVDKLLDAHEEKGE